MLNGIFYNARATTLKPTFANSYAQPITPANSEDIKHLFIDNPNSFEIQSDNDAAQSL